jgi:ketosteroid isomerase-like protein
MSRENVEIVRRMYETYHAGDAAASLACFDPDVVVDFSRRADGRVGQGREYLSQAVASWMGAWEEWQEEIEDIRDLGSQVYVAATQRGRGKGSGVEVEQSYAFLCEVGGGTITKVTYYPQAAEALEAAGLWE